MAQVHAESWMPYLVKQVELAKEKTRQPELEYETMKLRVLHEMHHSGKPVAKSLTDKLLSDHALPQALSTRTSSPCSHPYACSPGASTYACSPAASPFTSPNQMWPNAPTDHGSHHSSPSLDSLHLERWIIETAGNATDAPTSGGQASSNPVMGGGGAEMQMFREVPCEDKNTNTNGQGGCKNTSTNALDGNVYPGRYASANVLSSSVYVTDEYHHPKDGRPQGRGVNVNAGGERTTDGQVQAVGVNAHKADGRVHPSVAMYANMMDGQAHANAVGGRESKACGQAMDVYANMADGQAPAGAADGQVHPGMAVYKNAADEWARANAADGQVHTMNGYGYMVDEYAHVQDIDLDANPEAAAIDTIMAHANTSETFPTMD